MRVLGALFLGGLASCASADRNYLSSHDSFTRTADGFVYVSHTSTNMQEDSSGAEKNRLIVMQRFVERNGLCPTGYTVIDRAVLNRPKTSLGVSTLKDITYTGRCNPA